MSERLHSEFLTTCSKLMLCADLLPLVIKNTHTLFHSHLCSSDYQERAGREIIELFKEELWRKEEVIRKAARPQKELLERLRQDFATTTSALRKDLAGKDVDLKDQKERALNLLEAKERLETVSEDQLLKIGDLEDKVENLRESLIDAGAALKNISATNAKLESERDDQREIIVQLEMVSQDRLSHVGELESKVAAQKAVIMDLEMVSRTTTNKYTKLEKLQYETSKKADWQAGELKEMHEKLEALMSLSRRTLVAPADQHSRDPEPRLNKGNAAYDPIVIDHEPEQEVVESHVGAPPPAATPPPPPSLSNMPPPSARAMNLCSSLSDGKPSVDPSDSQGSTWSEANATAADPNSRKRKGDGKFAPSAKTPKRNGRKR